MRATGPHLISHIISPVWDIHDHEVYDLSDRERSHLYGTKLVMTAGENGHEIRNLTETCLLWSHNPPPCLSWVNLAAGNRSLMRNQLQCLKDTEEAKAEVLSAPETFGPSSDSLYPWAGTQGTVHVGCSDSMCLEDNTAYKTGTAGGRIKTGKGLGFFCSAFDWTAGPLPDLRALEDLRRELSLICSLLLCCCCLLCVE